MVERHGFFAFANTQIIMAKYIQSRIDIKTWYSCMKRTRATNYSRKEWLLAAQHDNTLQAIMAFFCHIVIL